jgi:hypothetical protein
MEAQPLQAEDQRCARPSRAVWNSGGASHAVGGDEREIDPERAEQPGAYFFITISTSCTVEAMTTM